MAKAKTLSQKEASKMKTYCIQEKDFPGLAMERWTVSSIRAME